MTPYVLVLVVGPVQSMIAAARKSRDLWSGSGLLSELAKACALSLQEQGADLIFPAIQDKKALERNSILSVGNKIQAQINVTDQDQLRSILANAKAATRQRFLDEAKLAKQEIKHQSDIRDDVWSRQVDDYVEVQAAWAKIDESQNYQKAVTLATKVLAARKATREFSQTTANPYDEGLMLPKSSLDGTRETVLNEDKKKALTSLTRLQLGLSQSEQLDCIGVVKRLGLKDQADQFTPFSRIAAQGWIDHVLQNEQSKLLLEQVCDRYKTLVGLNLATNVRGNEKIYSALPFDGQFLYRSRLDAEIQQCNEADVATALLEFKQAIEPLWRKHGQPCSYGVLLLADGDRMGELLDKAQNIDNHKKITTALSDFAGGVSATMRQYQGHCIYSGGDDVLGFVPLHQAYDCAKALSVSFGQALEKVATTLHAEKPPTLSVGLAIVHYMTPLSVIRELAQKAEKYAKGDHIADIEQRRDALGICLDVRSGNTTLLRFSWSDQEAHKDLKYWVSLYLAENISSRIAYDTRAIDLRTQGISNDQTLQQGIQKAEFMLMLKKAHLANGQKIAQAVQDKLMERVDRIGLQLLSDELIVARWFAAKTQQDLGRDGQ